MDKRPRLGDHGQADGLGRHACRDEVLASPPIRQAARDELAEAIASITSGDTCAHWLAKLDDAGVPCGPIRTYAEVTGATLPIIGLLVKAASGWIGST